MKTNPAYLKQKRERYAQQKSLGLCAYLGCDNPAHAEHAILKAQRMTRPDFLKIADRICQKSIQRDLHSVVFPFDVKTETTV